MKHGPLALLGTLGILVSLGGCGLNPDDSAFYGPSMVAQNAPSTSLADHFGGVPPASQFTVVQGTVTAIEPDHQGQLVHQVFILQETAPQQDTLEVDNDVTMGTRVPVQVGESLTIKGILYHDPGKDGIHWTHHASQSGDAGWIRTPNGQIYQ